MQSATPVTVSDKYEKFFKNNYYALILLKFISVELDSTHYAEGIDPKKQREIEHEVLVAGTDLK